MAEDKKKIDGVNRTKLGSSAATKPKQGDGTADLLARQLNQKEKEKTEAKRKKKTSSTPEVEQPEEPKESEGKKGAKYYYTIGKNGKPVRRRIRTESQYEQPDITRSKGLGQLASERMMKGEGLGKSIKGAMSDKIGAVGMSIKKTFDPLNVLSKISPLAATAYGMKRKRSLSDISYFTGVQAPNPLQEEDEAPHSGAHSGDKATKETPKGTKLKSMKGATGILTSIYKLISEKFEDDKKLREIDSNFKEEEKAESDKKHKELIDAVLSLGGKLGKNEKDKPEKKEGFLSKILGGLESLLALSGLKSVGKAISKVGGKAVRGIVSVGKSAANYGGKAVRGLISTGKSLVKGGATIMKKTASYGSKAMTGMKSALGFGKAAKTSAKVGETAAKGASAVETGAKIGATVAKGASAVETGAKVGNTVAKGANAIETGVKVGATAAKGASAVATGAKVGATAAKGASAVEKAALLSPKPGTATKVAETAEKAGSQIAKGAKAGATASKIAKDGSKLLKGGGKLLGFLKAIPGLGVIAAGADMIIRIKEVNDKLEAGEITDTEYKKEITKAVGDGLMGGALPIVGVAAGTLIGGPVGGIIGGLTGVGATLMGADKAGGYVAGKLYDFFVDDKKSSGGDTAKKPSVPTTSTAPATPKTDIPAKTTEGTLSGVTTEQVKSHPNFKKYYDEAKQFSGTSDADAYSQAAMQVKDDMIKSPKASLAPATSSKLGERASTSTLENKELTGPVSQASNQPIIVNAPTTTVMNGGRGGGSSTPVGVRNDDPVLTRLQYQNTRMV